MGIRACRKIIIGYLRSLWLDWPLPNSAMDFKFSSSENNFMKIYISRDGQQFGPYSLEQAKQYLREGNLKQTDLACHDGQNWIPLPKVPGITQEPTPRATQPNRLPKRQGRSPTRPGIKAKPHSAKPIGSRLSTGMSRLDKSSDKWKILSYAGAGLTFLCIFLPWYAVSVTARGISNSKSVNGFNDGVDNWGILTLVATMIAVAMTFFPQTKKFSAIPMGVAALGALLPIFTTDSNSVKIFGSTMSAGTSWGLWLCLAFAVTTCFFMFLNSKENP